MTEENTQEKKGHFLDLKIPLGGLLSFYGAVLLLFGLFSKKEIYARSLGINVNLIWGILILAVGLALLLTVIAKRRRQRAEKP
jgi:membrane-bound ClpP family serine protease